MAIRIKGTDKEVNILGRVHSTGRLLVSIKNNEGGVPTKEEVKDSELEDTEDNGELDTALSRVNILRKGGATT